MSPKVAGWLGMGAAALIAVGAGYLIAHAGTSLLGALVFVGATILLSVSAVTTLRKSWDDKLWPPGGRLISVSRLRRRQHTWAIVQCVLSPLMIAMSIVTLVWGEFVGVVYLLLGVMYGVSALWTLKVLRKSPPTSE